MSGTAPLRRSTETGGNTAPVVLIFSSLVVAIFGGLFGSFAFIVLAAVVLAIGVAWSEDMNAVFYVHIPTTIAVAFISVGMYLDEVTLWLIGTLFLSIHTVWLFICNHPVEEPDR